MCLSGRLRRLAGPTRTELCCCWRFVMASAALLPSSGWMLGSTPGSGSDLPSSPVWPRWGWGASQRSHSVSPLSSIWSGGGRALWWGISTGSSSSLLTRTATLRPGRETGKSHWDSQTEGHNLSSREWRKNKNPEDLLKCRQRTIPAYGSGVDLNRWMFL